MAIHVSLKVVVCDCVCVHLYMHVLLWVISIHLSSLFKSLKRRLKPSFIKCQFKHFANYCCVHLCMGV